MRRVLTPKILILAAFLQLWWVGPAAACFLLDFEVSTVPRLPAANEPFELIIDYQGSAGCILSEDLVVANSDLRFELNCNCPLVTTSPIPQQFRTNVAGLPGGAQSLEVINVGSVPAPRTVDVIQFLIGHAPAIPFSPITWTLFALTLAGAAVWVLRR